MPVELPPLEPRSPAPAPVRRRRRQAAAGRWRGQRGRRRLGRRDACAERRGARRRPTGPWGTATRRRPARPPGTARTHLEDGCGDDPAVAQLEGGSGAARDRRRPEQARVPPGPDEPDRAVDLQAGEGRAGSHVRAVGRDRGAGALAPGGGRVEARQGSRLDTPDVHLVDWKGEKGSLQRYRAGFETGDALAKRDPEAWKKFWDSQPARTWTSSTSSSRTRIATARTG